MLDNRDVRFDLFALGLFVLVVFLGLSLVSYNPADPIAELVYPFNQFYQPDVLTYPVAETTTNWCGPWGSLFASVTLEALGIGAYYAVISLAILTTLLLMRRDVDSPVLRTVGWVLSLVGFTTLATLILPWFTPGPVMGAGRLPGCAGCGHAQDAFRRSGRLHLGHQYLPRWAAALHRLHLGAPWTHAGNTHRCQRDRPQRASNRPCAGFEKPTCTRGRKRNLKTRRKESTKTRRNWKRKKNWQFELAVVVSLH